MAIDCRATFLPRPSLTTVSNLFETCDQWTAEWSCVFGGTVSDRDNWAGQLARHFQERGANGGIFWLHEGEGVTSGESLIYDAAGRVTAATQLRFAGFEIAIAQGVLVSAGEANRLILRGDAPDAVTTRFGSNAAAQAGALEILLGPPEIAGIVRFDLAAAAIQPLFKFFYGKPVRELTYPVWPGALNSSGIIKVQVHPLKPFDTELTRMTLSAPGPFATNLRTNKGSTVTLTPIPPNAGYGLQYNPVTGADPSYAVITGPWQMGIAGMPGATGPFQLMCGLSGIEYVEATPGTALNFVPGPAYAPGFGPGSTPGSSLLSDDAPGAAHPVRTPWVYPLSASASYFAQPSRGSLYTPALAGSGDFLNYFEIEAGSFPQGPTQATFPVAAYGGVAGDPNVVTAFEASVLSPQRRNVISSVIQSTGDGPRGVPFGGFDPGGTCMTGPTGRGPTGPAGPTGPFLYAATSQGLLSTFDQTGHTWETLTLASTDQGTQQLQLTEVAGPLRSALLTNNLFLVISSPGKLRSACSVNYKLTAESFTELLNQTKVPANVIRHVRYLQGILYESREYFETVLEAALGECWFKLYGSQFLDYAEFFELTIQGWTFRLEPYLWERFGTILILKFSELPLETLAADTNLWVEPRMFNDDVQATQGRLSQIIADAKEQSKSHSVFNYFVKTVIANQQENGTGTQIWTGVLFLNCVTPIDQLPPQLEGLAAGIDTSKFSAHHVGVNLSPLNYQGGPVIRIGDSSLFGLIFYQDPGDLQFDGNSAFQFKVLSLSVLFANSQVASFDSQIELLVAKLFGELATLLNTVHGNNLILRGTYQDHGGVKSYVFLEESLNQFTMNSQVLSMVEIDKVQFVTLLEGQQTGTVRSRFSFWGSMRFLELPGFDMFSFGPGYDSAGKLVTDGRIAFSNLAVDMSFRPSVPNDKPAFAFDASGVSLDLSQTVARTTSLYNRFPLTLTAILQGQEKESPASLGFMTVVTPLESQQLTYPWFGLQFSLNLGSPGALAAKAGFAATLLAAWSPSQPKYLVFAGMQLPGSTGGKRQISIEGPLVLKIGAIEFQVTPDENYLLRFRNIALSVLSLQFPPGGQTEVLLFGDPRGGASNTLGWYAAYKKDDPKSTSLMELPSGE